MFSHIDSNGKPRMVNTVLKPPTRRSARASCLLKMNAKTLCALKEKTLPKGDALALAQVAGIQAAKWTAHLIPLCHSLEARNISVDLSLEENCVRISSFVETISPTGPEMEALVACSISGLALYDMCKSLDSTLVLDSLRLEEKKGGKSGHRLEILKGRRAVLLTLSDRASRGIYKDESGPAAARILKQAGFNILTEEIMEDDLAKVVKKIKYLCSNFYPDLLLTLGSTGLSSRDIAPEATLKVIERTMPGISETLRAQFFPHHPATSFISRSVAGLRGKSLIINLPGSPNAVEEGLSLLVPAFAHIFQMVEGKNHD